MAAYEEGRSIARTHAQRDPDNMRWQQLLAASTEGVGDISLISGDLDTAAVSYSEALSIMRNLSERDPENAIHLSSLAVSLRKNSLLAVDPDAKEAMLKEAIAIVEDLVARGRLPADLQYYATILWTDLEQHWASRAANAE